MLRVQTIHWYTVHLRRCYTQTNDLVVDDPSGQRFDKSKFFDTEAESASLNRSFSSSSSLTFPLNKSAWICTKCRMPTTDQKRECGRIKDVKFYTCNACYRQFSLQMYLGMLFRMVQLHFCFTMVWIPSPDGAFFGDKMRNRGEFAGIVVLMVLTVSKTCRLIIDAKNTNSL